MPAAPAASSSWPVAPPVFPPGRYGRRRDPAWLRRQRRLGILLAAIAALAGLALAVKLYRQYADPPYAVSNVAVTARAELSISVDFDVRTPGGVAARCTVVAYGGDGAELTHDVVEIPAGPVDRGTAHVRHTVNTPRAALTADVAGCGPALTPTG